MIPLASIEGNAVFVVVVAVVGVINWLIEKSKKTSGSAPQQPSPRPQRPADTAAGDSEQERLRRFLEALGAPQQPQAAPPSQRPQSVAPRPTKPSQEISRRISQPIKGRMPSPRSAAQAPTRTARASKPARVQQTEEMARAGRIEEAATSIERISGEFSGMNVRVEMEPVQTLGRSAPMGIGNAGTTSVVERGGSPIAATLRKLLHNPTDLRAAFVAMEVLGTPRGLQN